MTDARCKIALPIHWLCCWMQTTHMTYALCCANHTLSADNNRCSDVLHTAPINIVHPASKEIELRRKFTDSLHVQRNPLVQHSNGCKSPYTYDTQSMPLWVLDWLLHQQRLMIGFQSSPQHILTNVSNSLFVLGVQSSLEGLQPFPRGCPTTFYNHCSRA